MNWQLYLPGLGLCLIGCTKPDLVEQLPVTGTYRTTVDASGQSVMPHTDPIQMPTDYTIEWRVEAHNKANRIQLVNQHGVVYKATLQGLQFTLDTLRFGNDPARLELMTGKGYFNGDTLFLTRIENRKGSLARLPIDLSLRRRSSKVAFIEIETTILYLLKSC